MSKNELSSEIIKLSISNRWDEAKKEWNLHSLYEDDKANKCLCGHFPIKKICEIKNSKNNNIAIVGNCCVKKFLNLESDKIFTSLRRIKNSNEKSVNLETIKYAHEKEWINITERKFYENIINKRKLTEKQQSWKVRINNKIKINFSNARKKKLKLFWIPTFTTITRKTRIKLHIFPQFTKPHKSSI